MQQDFHPVLNYHTFWSGQTDASTGSCSSRRTLGGRDSVVRILKGARRETGSVMRRAAWIGRSIQEVLGRKRHAEDKRDRVYQKTFSCGETLRVKRSLVRKGDFFVFT